MNKSDIIGRAEVFVEHLLKEQLPESRAFHNLQHTSNVVAAVQKICDYLNISEEGQEVLLLAAWFHDTGHIFTYEGHEDISCKIADGFFNKMGYDPTRRLKTHELIRATIMPQRPQSLPEQIICDADLFHLSLPEYCQTQELLRKELEQVFSKRFTDEEWQRQNIGFLKKHQYFTTYGKRILSSWKQKNILKCEQQLKSLLPLSKNKGT